ncbi:MAG: molecular chaperone [Rhizobacter sp.]|nr:molecular chaperone [Bacteriovorax sp.]
MSTSIRLKDKTNSTLFYLENDSDQPIAVTTTLLKREMTKDGIETNKKITDELTIYPSQLIIPAAEKRSVKVTWVGKTIPKVETAYRLVAEQLPIDIDKDKKQKASIKVLLKYVAALYIDPENFSSDVSFKKMDVDEKNVSFTFSNDGKKHQVLSNLEMKITGKKTIELKSDDLKGASGENVLAESERVFHFPKVGKFKDIQPSDKVKISFEKD